ncbi:MAG: hypothetical protein MMC33_010201 [Icmadophila ericetorum]|nr:hypothetical protein [Icmadophila ericetorum]
MLPSLVLVLFLSVSISVSISGSISGYPTPPHYLQAHPVPPNPTSPYKNLWVSIFGPIAPGLHYAVLAEEEDRIQVHFKGSVSAFDGHVVALEFLFPGRPRTQLHPLDFDVDTQAVNGSELEVGYGQQRTGSVYPGNGTLAVATVFQPADPPWFVCNETFKGVPLNKLRYRTVHVPTPQHCVDVELRLVNITKVAA